MTKAENELIKKLREAHKNTTYKAPRTGKTKKAFCTNPFKRIVNRIRLWRYNR